jgi:hypothetical protein
VEFFSQLVTKKIGITKGFKDLLGIAFLASPNLDAKSCEIAMF